MKQHFSATRLVFMLASIVIIIGFSAFSQKEKSSRYSFRKETDTPNIDTPTPLIHDRYLNVGDMDKIDAAIKKLEQQMERLNEQVNRMDFNKVQKDVNDAMQKVDFDKIERQINESLKKVDYQKMKKDLRESMVQAESFDRIKAQMEMAKAQLERQKANMAINNKDFKVDVDKAMRNAKEAMLKAKEELQNLKEFTNELEKDGLINKSKYYKIEVKAGELYINDKKQTKEVNDKYRKYYRKDNFIINLNEDGIRI